MELILTGTGTSQGVPVIGCNCKVCTSTDPRDNRLRSAAIIRHNDLSIAIDCGPDFRQQMLRIGQERLEHILLTHEHMDHVAGIDDVRAFNFTAGLTMNIWATERVQARLKSQFSYAFSDAPYPGAPVIKLHNLLDEPFEIEGLQITPIPVEHGNWPVLGFRINNVAYVTDVNRIPTNSLELLKDLDTLILGVLHRKPHHSHFHLEEGIRVAKQIGAKQTYFTHISHQMGLAKDVANELPDGIQLAHDGLAIQIR